MRAAYEAGEGTVEIAKKTGKSKTAVRNSLVRMGVKMRKSGPVRRSAMRQVGEEVAGRLILEAVSLGSHGSHGPGYKVKCTKCGKVRVVAASSIERRCQQCSCGPSKEREEYLGFGEITQSKMLNMMAGAEKRELEWGVSAEYLWGLYLRQDRKCALTGVPIDFKREKGGGSFGTASLDRVEPMVHYFERNVWWVHREVNEMKMARSLKDFRAWCHAVVAFA